MQLSFLPIELRKDDSAPEAASGPAQSDVHVDRIIGAIHPFQPGPDTRMCAVCGLTRDTHKQSFTKQTGFDTPFHQPLPDEPAPPSPLQEDEEEENNTNATPPSPMLWRFMAPNDDSTEFATPDGQTHNPLDPALLSSDEAAQLAEQTPPPGFHQPLSKRGPWGMESGDVGEWQSPNGGNFVPKGQLVLPMHVQAAAGDLPRDPMGNIKQDGPVFGATNPGLDPATQIESTHQGSPDPTGQAQRGRLHNFTQCPQCGVAVNGTEHDCPNAWCGHDLEGDNTASYDHWLVTGGVDQ